MLSFSRLHSTLDESAHQFYPTLLYSINANASIAISFISTALLYFFLTFIPSHPYICSPLQCPLGVSPFTTQLNNSYDRSLKFSSFCNTFTVAQLTVRVCPKIRYHYPHPYHLVSRSPICGGSGCGRDISISPCQWPITTSFSRISCLFLPCPSIAT